MNRFLKNNAGFTLVEMAVGLIILSVISAFGAAAFSGAMRFNAERKTYENMEVIADAITIYAQRHMRVPCPADPTLNNDVMLFGVERGAVDGSSNDIIDTFGVCDQADELEGMVPFATLGLPEKVARDHFGNLLTYRVSLTSAQTPESRFDPDVLVNQWCTTVPRWRADTNPDPAVVEINHINWSKAAFCCGTWEDSSDPALEGTQGDIQIFGGFGTILPDLSRQTVGLGGAEAEYRPREPTGSIPDITPSLDDLLGKNITPAPTPAITTTEPPIFPAYILVSHGLNGSGAYSETGTGVRAPLSGYLAAEIENANGDEKFYAPDRLAPVSPAGAFAVDLTKEAMDDLVFWATPAQVLGRLGRVSCARP